MLYYFDNSATTQVDPGVLETYMQVSQNYFANPSSAHQLGSEAHQLLEAARKQIANILTYKEEEIYFTSSGTEANNWVLQAIVPAMSKRHPKRNKILVSAIEHPSILRQLERVEEMGLEVRRLGVDNEGVIDLDLLKEELDDQCLLLSTMAVNNEVGSQQPLAAIQEILQTDPQVTWHVDGVQAVTCQLQAIKNPRIDLLTLSGHKFHAGRGTGILAIRQKVASEPLLMGGGQERNQRSGTENLASIVATSKALRIASDHQVVVRERLSQFRSAIIQSLRKNNWQVFAENVASPHIICTAFRGIPGEVLLHAMEEQGIYVSTTSACSSRSHQEHATLRQMHVDQELANSAIRISLSSQTSQEEVDYLINKIPEISLAFRR
ncbi:cysteine desulfurase family protein [Hutsoniella sourekii]|uniref:cysteine desulfurase family protein n=1 Tax=Hutsoniella sourekii TaxID=87650 RepID=UPI0004B6D4CF|nr:cysteine desulfurase family protein [Hutsoniella sourekii]